MKNFGVEVRFTPAYHAATNGAVERRHQTIKNALKAALVEMGDKHGSKWVQALPWVLLGKRVQVQPDLDASAAQLVFGKSLVLPGQALGVPGPSLTNLQTRSLLEELYKLDSRPALQTSSNVSPIDIAFTDRATHVYVKNENQQGLQPKFSGPYIITSRPSRSQVEVRVGSFADGRPRLQKFHWSHCKIAHLREDAQAVERQGPGRPRSSKPDPVQAEDQVQAEEMDADTLSGKPPHPDYIKKGPIVTQEMFEKLPEVLQQFENSRPIRTTRNPNPVYTD